MRSLFVVLTVLLCAKEAHVSGGYSECFTDVDAVICIESDSRKRFRDDEQARGWIGEHRTQAERRLFTLVPRLRVAFAEARRQQLPVADVDDWRLRADVVDAAGARRVRLELGTFDRQIIDLTFTTTRALTATEATWLRERFEQELRTPAYDPDREREGLYAPSLQLHVAPTVIEVAPSRPGLPPLPPPSPPRAAPPSPSPPAPPLSVEDVRAWRPLWVADDSVGADRVALGIGTTMRVSPLAAQVWRPWLTTQVQALRKAWSSSTCALPKGITGDRSDMSSGFRALDGFRPWGPLLLDTDVQARVDDGAIVRMARLSLPKTNTRADSIYGDLTGCLNAATKQAPLSPPPSRGHKR